MLLISIMVVVVLVFAKMVIMMIVFTSTLITICGCAMMLRNSRKIKRKVRCYAERLQLNKGIDYVEKERMVNLESDQ